LALSGPRPPRRLVAAYPVLRHRDFALLWSGGGVSAAGDWLLALALPYHVYARTGSTLASAALFMVNMAPGVLFGSVAGVFADRWDRRRTMLAADLVRAAVVLLMLPIAASDAWLWLAYPLVFAESTTSRFFRPAKGALLPRLVPEDELLSANALDAVGDSVIRLLAPALGGFLLARAGLGPVLLDDAGSYLFSALMVALLRAPPTPVRPGETAAAVSRWRAFWTDWLAGLRLVAVDRYVRNVFLVNALANVGSGVFGPLHAPFVQDLLRAGPEVLGWTVTATGVGTLATGLVLGRTARPPSPARLAAAGQVVLGLALLASFHAGDVVAVVALGVPAGVGLASMVGFGTAIQAGVAEHARGRVLGTFWTTFALAMLLGQLVASTLPAGIGLLPTLDLAGGLHVAAGLLGLVLLPATAATATRRIDR
jgi:MFS family permease